MSSGGQFGASLAVLALVAAGGLMGFMLLAFGASGTPSESFRRQWRITLSAGAGVVGLCALGALAAVWLAERVDVAIGIASVPLVLCVLAVIGVLVITRRP